MLLRRRDDSYRSGHPTPADTLLVIEASNPTIGSGRRDELPTYAGYSISEVWLPDSNSPRIEART